MVVDIHMVGLSRAVGLRTQFEMDEEEPEAAWLRMMLRDAAYPGTH